MRKPRLEIQGGLYHHIITQRNNRQPILHQMTTAADSSRYSPTKKQHSLSTSLPGPVIEVATFDGATRPSSTSTLLEWARTDQLSDKRAALGVRKQLDRNNSRVRPADRQPNLDHRPEWQPYPVLLRRDAGPAQQRGRRPGQQHRSTDFEHRL